MVRYKPSKNAVCPCGSEKKYKKCCMGKLTGRQEEYYWLVQKERMIKDKIFLSNQPEIGEQIEICKQEYLQATGHTQDELIENYTVSFFDWMMNDAMVACGEKFVKWVLVNFQPMFNPVEAEIMSHLAEKTQSGIYEIVNVDAENWKIDIKEIISGKTYSLTERSGTSITVKGDLVFARINEVFGKHYASGLLQKYPRHVLEELKKFVEEHFEATKKKEEITYEEFMNKNFFLISSFKIEPPTFLNRLGEKLKICEARYSIKTNIEDLLDWFALNRHTFEILEVTGKGKKIDAEIAILSKEKQDKKAGEKQLVLFNEVLDGEGTAIHTLGSIYIKNGELEIFSTSEKTFGQIQSGLQEEFGNKLFLEKEKIIDGNDSELIDKEDSKCEETLERTEEQDSVMAMIMTRYYTDWCDQKIPALGNITPRQAIKTAGGKEKVKNLLANIENAELNKKLNNKFYFPAEKIIRKELNFCE